MEARPLRVPEEGPLCGRFFVFEDLPRVPGILHLVDDADPSFVIETCSDLSSSDLTDCLHPLAYRSSEPSILFLRVTERIASRSSMDEALRQILPFPLEAVRPEDRTEWKERARALAVTRTEPRTRICSVLWEDRKIFVSEKSVDDRIVRFLSSWFSCRLLTDPVLWKESSEAPSLLLSILERQIDRNQDPQIDRDLWVEEASIRIDRSRMKGPVRRTTEAFEALLRRHPAAVPVVDSLVVSVRLPNGVSKISLDPSGAYRVELPPSKGGLPVDRIRRRSRDLDLSFRLLGKELRASHDAIHPG